MDEAQILIALIQGPDGNLMVRGPVDNVVQALGLLETAKVLVVQHNANKAKPQVVPVSAMPPGLKVVGHG